MKVNDALQAEPLAAPNTDDLTASLADESDLIIIPVGPASKRNLDYVAIDYQKRGFQSAILEKQNHHARLGDLLKEVDAQHNRIVTEITEFFVTRNSHFIDQIAVLENKMNEIQAKKEAYESTLDGLLVEKQEVKTELSQMQEELNTIVKSVGQSKSQLLEKRLAQMQAELDGLMAIHHGAEDKQNGRFTEKNKQLNQERINFLTGLKKDYQESFDAVKVRIKGFDKAGISLALANTLVSIGVLGTVLAGWLFSLWTGPKPVQNEVGNIVNNSSVLFFLLKEFTRFSLRYNRTELVVGILVFFALLFAISWACHRLLVQFKFIADPASEEGRKMHETEFELNFADQDDFFKSQLKGTSWFAFWLKLTPFLLFILVVLVVLGRASLQHPQDDEFQNMFDSLVNQNFGSMLCVLASGLIYLYVIKIIEPRHVSATESKEYLMKETVGSNWELITTFGLFVVLLIAFLTSFSSLALITDARKLFLMAFFATTVCAGFCLSYGLRYRELIANYDLLEKHLYKLTELIYRISKPISYLENQSFQERISDLQNKILRMIEKRNALALFLIDRKDESAASPVLLGSSHILFTPLKAGRRFLLYLWRLSLPVRQWFMGRLQKKIERIINKDELFSEEEILYFPELVAEVDELQKAISTRTKRLATLNQQQEDYWRETGLYGSIQQQLAKRRKAVDELKKCLEDDLAERHNELLRVDAIASKKKDLLTEGFSTGLWYLKHGDDLRSYYLDPSESPSLLHT